jgi:hypothetical protein
MGETQKQVEVLRPEDMVGIFGVKVDDGSFEPISKDQKKQDFLAYKDFVLGIQSASVEQAKRTQDPNQAVNVDFGQFLQRGSEHFSENATHFILDNTKIVPQLPTQPNAITPPEDPNAPAPDAEVSAPEAMVEPMTPEMAGAISNMQPDGKTMPSTFPVRSVKSPVLGV